MACLNIKFIYNNLHCILPFQESGKWQEKYNLLLQAGDAVKLREQYTKLESQYKALARVVTTVPQSSDAAKVNMLFVFYQFTFCLY